MRVEAPERLRSCRLLAGGHIFGNVVVHLDPQLVLAASYLVGYVEAERRIAAAMNADVLAVDVNGRLVIHRAETEKQSFVLFGRIDGKFSRVLAVLYKARVVNPRKLGFGCERHLDFMCGGHAVGEKTPLPVENNQSVAVELRIWAFRS